MKIKYSLDIKHVWFLLCGICLIALDVESLRKMINKMLSYERGIPHQKLLRIFKVPHKRYCSKRYLRSTERRITGDGSQWHSWAQRIFLMNIPATWHSPLTKSTPKKVVGESITKPLGSIASHQIWARMTSPPCHLEIAPNCYHINKIQSRRSSSHSVSSKSKVFDRFECCR